MAFFPAANGYSPAAAMQAYAAAGAYAAPQTMPVDVGADRRQLDALQAYQDYQNYAAAEAMQVTAYARAGVPGFSAASSSVPGSKAAPLPAHQAQRIGSLTVTGCQDGVVAPFVRGAYRYHSENHGKPCFIKAEQSDGLDVYVYFWDRRDGPSLNGWWFSPKLGCDAVWAHNPSLTSALPPATGWRVPYDAEVDPTFIVACHPKAAAKKRDASDAALPAREGKHKQPVVVIPPDAMRQEPKLTDSSIRRCAEAQAARIKQEQQLQQENAQTPQRLADLRVMVGAAEGMVERVKLQAKPLINHRTLSDDRVIAIANEVVPACFDCQAALEVCADFIKGQEELAEQAVQEEVAKIMATLKAQAHETEVLSKVTRVFKRNSQERKEKTEKEAAAVEYADHIFATYDTDGDGLLTGSEIRGLAKVEHSVELTDARLQTIVAALSAKGAGVPKASCAKLREMILSPTILTLTGAEAAAAQAPEADEEEARKRAQRAEEEERWKREAKSKFVALDGQMAEVQAKVREATVVMEEAVAKVQKVEARLLALNRSKTMPDTAVDWLGALAASVVESDKPIEVLEQHSASLNYGTLEPKAVLHAQDQSRKLSNTVQELRARVAVARDALKGSRT